MARPKMFGDDPPHIMRLYLRQSEFDWLDKQAHEASRKLGRIVSKSRIIRNLMKKAQTDDKPFTRS